MAGWIKWSKGLPSKPEVIRLARLVDRPRDTVVVSLMRFWEWTDDSIGEEDIQPDGCGVIVLSPIRGDNVITIDDIAGVPGFTEGLIAVGWLRLVDDRLELPNFGRHNGETAKTRARNSKSQQRKRRGGGGGGEADSGDSEADSVIEMSSSSGDISMTRGEERRVLKDPPAPRVGGEGVLTIQPAERRTSPPSESPPVEPSQFVRFWRAYPRREAKADARKAFDKLAPDAGLFDRMLAALSRQCLSDQWTREGGRFRPLPATWINGRRWEDEPATTVARQDTRAEPGRGSADDPAFLAASGLDPLPARRGGAA